MDRRTFGHLLVGLSVVSTKSGATAKAKVVKSNLSDEIKKEQEHLASLRDWLNSSKSNPYSAAYVPGIQELVSLSENRLNRLQSRV